MAWIETMCEAYMPGWRLLDAEWRQTRISRMARVLAVIDPLIRADERRRLQHGYDGETPPEGGG